MSSANETEIFQHYQVLKRPDGALWELGRGAMGITYKAFDTNLRCDVALKVINALHLNSETARARFLREARAAAGLRHRNVASVYHLGNDDQSFFYAMEFVDGETVECLVKETGPMPPVDALQIVVQIARALGAAAKQNLVHRDIKPANIMVTREDDEEEQFVVKVIDFGLARPAIGGEGSAHITMGGFVGTPQFASPEQLEEKDLDARSDIYSLGVTLWFMIAGKPPFTGPLGSVFIQQLTKEPPWAQLEGTPEPVRALLAGMLEKDPDKRPQTPVELRRQVEACLRQLPATDRPLAPAPSTSSATLAESVTGTEAPLTQSAPWAAGGMLAGRYELGELAGEGNNGRVFRAIDRQADNARVAIKILHGDVLASSAERRRVEGELEKLRGAGHPNLLEFQGLQETADSLFLVGEWVNGFTLVDLLRSRGRLPLPETLRLLAQAAVAADHAREFDLRRLELSLHQMMTAFEAPAGGGTLDPRGALTASLEEWPPFLLKIDALGITREAGDSVTWSGDQTMMPASLGRDTQTSIRGFVEGSDLFALGLMAYELLNGAPPAREARYVALAALNEAANMVLRKALSPNPGFATNVDFFRALVEASGLPEVYLDAAAGGAERETYAVDRLPVSGTGAEEAGATLILGDGESLPLAEPVEARGPSAEEREEAERVAAEQAEAERVAAEKAAFEREEAERIEAERVEAERIEAERVAAEREKARRVEAERREAERIEAERVAAERAEAKRQEAIRLKAEKAEADRIVAERAEAQRIEAERLAAERAEAKRLEAERLKAEKAKADRIMAERAEAKRVEAERLNLEKAEKAEAARLERERVKAEKAETRRVEAERARAAASLRDVASVSGAESTQPAPPAKKKMIVTVAAGVAVLGAIGILTISHARKETPAAPAKTALRTEPPASVETPVVQPSAPAVAEATPDLSMPTPAAAVEPSPAVSEPSATPALADVNPPTPAAATPEPASRPAANKPDESDERRSAKNDRAAKLADEKKHSADTAANRSKDEEREKRPASEPKKKPSATLAASKPAEKPKPTPVPVNRPAAPFILR